MQPPHRGRWRSGGLTAVVGLGDGIKLLLPGGVPQHQPYLLVIDAATMSGDGHTQQTLSQL